MIRKILMYASNLIKNNGPELCARFVKLSFSNYLQFRFNKDTHFLRLLFDEQLQTLPCQFAIMKFVAKLGR